MNPKNDFHGFVWGKEDFSTAFVFASRMTTISMDEENRKASIIEGGAAAKKLYSFFESKSKLELTDEWYRTHDKISNYTVSGLQPKRLISIVAYVEPLNTDVESIL